MPVLGLGVDLVDSRRVERLISRDEDIFRARILGECERSEIPASASKPRRVFAYARSIAAKEAFLKALGTGLAQGMRWTEIEIVKGDGLKPRLAICGEAARKLACLRADAIQLSLSSLLRSPGSQVMAVVMLTRNEPHEIPL